MEIKRQPPFWVVLVLIVRFIFKRFQRMALGPPKWDEVDVKSKVVVITGANAGLGKLTAYEMARRGATVVLACRNLDSGNRVADTIKRSTKNPHVITLELDLSKYDSIRRFCAVVGAKYREIDVLINNGGIFDARETIQRTDQTLLEKHFAVNHLGHFLLTNLLIPNLQRSTHSRVVTIGSTADFIEELDLDDLTWQRQPPRSGYGYLMGRIFGKAYAASKFANSLFSQELGYRLKSTGVTTYALCPGMVAGTQLFKYDSVIDKVINKIVLKLIGLSPQEGIETILYCSLAKQCQNETGLYYQFCQVHPYQNFRNAHNREFGKKLWEISERLAGLE